MGLLEPITHKQEIEGLLAEAKEKYDAASKKFEDQKGKTTKQLERLGEVKIKAWSGGMDDFVANFSAFANIEVNKTVDTNLKFLGSDEKPQEILINMTQASMTAGELAQTGALAIGTGALVGIASYGGSMMFGTASTGTAISALSGAAKTNATLAWFGGGSKAAGGLGMVGGKLVLAGVVVAPVLAVAAVITSAKSKEKLAEAKKVHAEAMDAVEKLEAMTTGMQGIEKMTANYSRFILQLNRKFKPFVEELERIKNNHASENGEVIDFNDLTLVEQKTVHLSWLMAQIFYHVLSTPIMTSNGETSPEAAKVLNGAEKEYKQLKRDTFKMSGDEAAAADILWELPSRRMIAINSVAVMAFVVSAIMVFPSSILAGLSCIIGAVIAFPIFIKFKHLPASKQYFWRIVRLVGAIVFVLVTNLLLR